MYVWHPKTFAPHTFAAGLVQEAQGPLLRSAGVILGLGEQDDALEALWESLFLGCYRCDQPHGP